MRRAQLWLPLIGLALISALVTYGLYAPRTEIVHSQMIAKPLPQFQLPTAIAGQKGLSTQDFKDGKPRLLNIFASWCLPCQAEAPQLAALARSGAIIEGIAVRDKPEDLAAMFAKSGNPYTHIGADNDMHVQLLLGASGIPESYIISGDGQILYQHIGDIRPEHVAMLLEKIKAAK